MSCPLIPLENRIIVEDEPVETRTRGGLVMPDRAQAQPTWGKVVAIGGCCTRDGAFREPPIAVGDRVLFGEHCGGEIWIDDVKYRILGLGEVSGFDVRVREELTAMSSL